MDGRIAEDDPPKGYIRGLSGPQGRRLAVRLIPGALMPAARGDHFEPIDRQAARGAPVTPTTLARHRQCPGTASNGAVRVPYSG